MQDPGASNFLRRAAAGRAERLACFPLLAQTYSISRGFLGSLLISKEGASEFKEKQFLTVENAISRALSTLIETIFAITGFSLPSLVFRSS